MTYVMLNSFYLPKSNTFHSTDFEDIKINSIDAKNPSTIHLKKNIWYFFKFVSNFKKKISGWTKRLISKIKYLDIFLLCRYCFCKIVYILIKSIKLKCYYNNSTIFMPGVLKRRFCRLHSLMVNQTPIRVAETTF